jgi:hypothetical protein
MKSREEWVSLMWWYGGHGMSPGHTVREQVIGWSCLNFVARQVRHPQHGAFRVVWPQGKGFLTNPKLLRLEPLDGQAAAQDDYPTFIDGRYEESWEMGIEVAA